MPDATIPEKDECEFSWIEIILIAGIMLFIIQRTGHFKAGKAFENGSCFFITLV